MSVKRSPLDHPTGLWSAQHLWATGILLPAERHAGVMARLVTRVSPPCPYLARLTLRPMCAEVVGK